MTTRFNIGLARMADGLTTAGARHRDRPIGFFGGDHCRRHRWRARVCITNVTGTVPDVCQGTPTAQCAIPTPLSVWDTILPTDESTRSWPTTSSTPSSGTTVLTIGSKRYGVEATSPGLVKNAPHPDGESARRLARWRPARLRQKLVQDQPPRARTLCSTGQRSDRIPKSSRICRQKGAAERRLPATRAACSSTRACARRMITMNGINKAMTASARRWPQSTRCAGGSPCSKSLSAHGRPASPAQAAIDRSAPGSCQSASAICSWRNRWRNPAPARRCHVFSLNSRRPATLRERGTPTPWDHSRGASESRGARAVQLASFV